MERKRVKEYKDSVFEHQLGFTRFAMVFSSLGILVLIGLDRFYYNDFVFNQRLRLVMLGLNVSLILMLYLIPKYEIYVRVFFILQATVSLSLEGLLVVRAWNVEQSSFIYEYQTYFLFLVGVVLMCTMISYSLVWIYAVNIISFIAAAIYFGDLTIVFSMTGLVVVFLSVSLGIFSRYFLSNQVLQYESNKRLNEQIVELNLEVAKRQNLQYKLREMATYDGLTNCYTRGVGITQLEKSIGIVRKAFKSLSICYIDMNNLKELNDRFGHKIGDAYIIGLVEILNECSGPDDYVIRLGGDEFLLVMPGSTFFEAERLWRSVTDKVETFSHQGTSIDFPLEVSHGIVEYVDGNYKNIEVMLDAADALMYKEKIESKRKIAYK